MKSKTYTLKTEKINGKEYFDILVELFIKPGLINEWDKQRYIKERVAAALLMKICPDFHFFYSLIRLHGKFNSLCGLLSKKYHDIEEMYKKYILDNPKKISYALEDKPVVKIEEIKKAKSLIEFLDN